MVIRRLTKEQIFTLASLTCGILLFAITGFWFSQPDDVCAQPICSRIVLVNCFTGNCDNRCKTVSGNANSVAIASSQVNPAGDWIAICAN